MTTFITRAGWGHYGLRGGYSIAGNQVDKAVFHHTPGQDPHGGYGAAIEELHQVLGGHLSNGWGDIGYSWLVSGEYAFEGRGFWRSGAHAPGANSTSVGIAFLLDGRNRQPTPTEWQAARDIMARAVHEGACQGAYGIYGHRDWVATECPSHYVYDHLTDYWATDLAPAAEPPEEEPDIMKMTQVHDPAGKVWGVWGPFKLHITDPDHLALLLARGFLSEEVTPLANSWDIANLVEVHPGQFD